MAKLSYSSFFTNPRILAVTLLGFASGLPLALTSSTLQAWYTVSGVDLVTIGFIGWVGLPYIYKFIWAPLMDRFIPPFLGRRRGWMLITQILLIVGIASMAFFNPVYSPWMLGFVALFVAFLSASQDVAIDAYRTDLLEPKERGLGTALAVMGYRGAMLVASALALIMASFVGWHFTYLLMAGLMLIGVLTSWFGPNAEHHNVSRPQTLTQATIEPFKEFLSRKQAILLLVFILLYKFGDAFAGSLTVTFLLRGVGFSLIDVGSINKTVGVSATIFGVFIAGIALVRLSLWRSLMWFGILQAVSNLMLVFLAIAGKNYALMIGAIFIENFCGGLGTAAFTAFVMSLCDKRYTATQFALLSSLASVGRVIIGPLAAEAVMYVGWANFFIGSVFLSLPGLVLLIYLRKNISENCNILDEKDK